MRLTDKELEKVKEKYHVDQLWSYSRLDTYKTSPYLYYLKYVKHEQPKKDLVSPYGIIGNAAHSILERLYKGEIEPEAMCDEFRNEYDMQIELFGLKFNNTDGQLNKSIQMKYKADLEHFFKNYKKDSYTHKMEQFLATEIISGIVVQGYSDDIYKDEEGIFHINDFKTSSKHGFTGEGLKDHAAQIILYAKALEQAGIPADKITGHFNMLKYVNIDCELKNGSVKTSTVERCEIGSKMQSKVKTWLKAFDYSDEDQNNILGAILEDNSLSVLPDQIREKFQVNDCYIKIENPLSLYDDLKKEIIDIVSEIDNKTHEFNETHDDHVWWDDDELLKKNSYYHVQLSDYTVQQHLPFWEWCQRIENEKDTADDLLGTVQKIDKQSDNDDSWLEKLI